ncbi:reverse transcriptase domain-containing protein [Tanacetum coccineum]
MKLNPKKCSFGMEEGKFLGYIVTSEGIRANPEKEKAVMDMPHKEPSSRCSPLRSLLNNSGALGRLAKWAVKLGTYGICPKGSSKGSGLGRLFSRPSNKDKCYTGGSGAGLILIAPDDVKYSYALRLNFSNSNNDAEYEALLAGLRIAKEMQVRDIHAFVDSKLVASQVEGSYVAKGERMIKYQEKV